MELGGDRGREWGALGARSARRPLSGYREQVAHPLLKRGSKGDMVVWAQQRLVGAGHDLPVTGFYGPLTAAAVRARLRPASRPLSASLPALAYEIAAGPAP